jgi:glycosyltransferase involved in cell wall biosynthesis
MMARISTGIIAISEQRNMNSATYTKYVHEKIKTIPLGFDLSRFSLNQEVLRQQFRDKYKLSDDTLAIGIIGRLVPIKNHPLFIESWKQLIQEHGKKSTHSLLAWRRQGHIGSDVSEFKHHLQYT